VKRRLLLILLIPVLVIVAPIALAIGILRAAEIDVPSVLQSLVGTAAIPQGLVDAYALLRFPLHLVFVALIFFLAWLLSRASWGLAGLILRATGYSPDRERPVPDDTDVAPITPERRRLTVQQLLAGFINFIVFTVAVILAVSQFVDLTNLAVVATIAANAFGFAARDYIGDLLNGVSNIFEDRFYVGDNISIFRVGDTLEGTVEGVTVRTISLRTRGGELIIVPQGEVRILRNYARGSFTGVDITCRVAPTDLPAAMTLLLALGEEAPALLPDIIEPWTLVAEDGELGSASAIKIHARARYAHGAGLRLQIMMLVEERLSAAGISLAA
jgi:small-conductance mechanosensitive channel